MGVRGEAEKVVAPTNEEIENWHAFYVFFKRLHQGWHDDALEVDALVRGDFVTADTIPTPPPYPPSVSPPTSVQKTSISHPWRRGDYFFCESCGQRKQWFRETPPWRGAICAACYNAELARIEAARGRRA